MKEHLERQIDAVRRRIRRLEDEAALHRAMGRDALADKIENEQRKAEIEAGHLEHFMRSAA